MIDNIANNETAVSKRKQNSTDLKDRERLIEYVHNQGKPVREAADLLHIRIRTAYNILKVFEKENRIATMPRIGRRPLYGIEFAKHVEEYFVDKKPDATLKECQDYIAANPRKFGVLVPSLSTLDRICIQRKVSLKRLSLAPKARNCPRTIKLRKLYVVQLQKAIDAGKALIYLDEMGSNLHTRRNYGRNRIGKPAVITVPTQRGDNLSVCAAIGNFGLVHQRAKFLAYNQDEFLVFLDEMFAKLSPDLEHAIIMDNVGFHKTPRVKSWFAARKNLEPLFLPPYSPFLNAIEEANAKVRHLICLARPSATNRLLDSVKQAWESLTAADCLGYIRHTKEYHAQCLMGVPILKEAEPDCLHFLVESDTSEDDREFSDLSDEIADVDNF